MLEIKNGAVFIFAFFKNASDWQMIESPPNPQIPPAIGKAIGLFNCANSFSPPVHSSPPEIMTLKIPFIGKKQNKTSQKR